MNISGGTFTFPWKSVKSTLMMNDKMGMPDQPMPDQPVVETIDIGKVKVMVDDSLVKKVGQLVANHSKEALSVIRAWMDEKA